ncbi:MAG TPA: ROK family protein [Dehalococcoidia bacterium]|jgi:hypothetical protein|nr:ROK family protein [Dehalococcoidia bacterium]
MANLPDPALVAVQFSDLAARVMLTDKTHTVIHDQSFEIREMLDQEQWAWDIGGYIATVFALEGKKRSAAAIAVCCPGFVDESSGRLISSRSNPLWDDLDVVSELRGHFDVPIMATDELRVALRAEMILADIPGAESTLYLRLDERSSAVAAYSTSRIIFGGAESFDVSSMLPIFPQTLEKDSEMYESLVINLSETLGYIRPDVIIIDAFADHFESIKIALETLCQSLGLAVKILPAKVDADRLILGTVHLASNLAFENRLY